MNGFRAASLTGLLASLAIMIGSAAPAGAATRNQDWQVGFSFNCNNASQCSLPLGGFWGWYAFHSDGTGDATLTGCSHGAGQNGAGHFNVDIYAWHIDSETGDFVIDSSNGPPFVDGDTGIPAVAGHFSAHPFPGVSIEATVKQNPTTSGP